MTIRRPMAGKVTIIDLDGPEGNAYALMAFAQSFAKGLDMPVDTILDQMKAGDYTHLIKVFDEWFGRHITLVTEQEDLLKVACRGSETYVS